MTMNLLYKNNWIFFQKNLSKIKIQKLLINKEDKEVLDQSFLQKDNSSKKYAVKAQNTINISTGKINQNQLKLCKEEAQKMRECKHKNVVEIHSDFEIGFYHFIQMNLCKCSLENWIDQNQKQINDMLFLHKVNQIIDGVEYLHNKGYILRDLTIRNILLTTDGVIKLCDFGLAKKYDSSFKSSAQYSSNARGAFLYFPPELFEDLNNGKEQVKQTIQGDIWALGICLSLLGGTKANDFIQVTNPQFIIPDSRYVSKKANQLIKYILNRNPIERPSIQQIRERIYSLFFENDANESIQVSQQIVQNNQKVSQITFERLIDFNFKQVEDIYIKYQQYAKQHPNNIDILITLGYIEAASHSNFSDSKKYFEKSLELNNNEIDAYLGLCFIVIQTRQYNQFKQAFSYLEICLSLRKDYWRTYYYKSWLLYLSGRDSEGLEFLDIGQSLKKDSIQLQSLRILFLLFHINDEQKAKELTEKAIKQNTNNDPSIFFRVAVYFESNKNCKDISKAIHYYEQALEYNSLELRAMIHLSFIYKQNENLEEFEKYLNKAKLLYSQNSIFINFLGQIEENDNKKLKLFEESIKYDEENRYAYFNIAKLFQKQNKYDEAIKQYEKVLEFKPNDINSQQNIGFILGYNKQDYQKSILFYQNAIKLNQKDTKLLLEIAGIYSFMKDYKNTAQYLNQCLKIDPKNSLAYAGLADIEKENNNIKNYEEYKIKQIANNPKDEDALFEIALHFQDKDFKKSKQYFQQLIQLNPKYDEYFSIFNNQLKK